QLFAVLRMRVACSSNASRRKRMHNTGPFGEGLSRLCAVVAASTASEMAAQVRLALREATTIELRLDYLASDAERTRFLAWLRRQLVRRAQSIAACRRRAGGGLFDGSAAAELGWLERARDAGCAWCDLEVETHRSLPRNFRSRRILPRVLVS